MKKPSRRQRIDRKALLFDQLARIAISVRLPHSSGVIIVKRAEDARSIAGTLETWLTALTPEEPPVAEVET